MQLARLIIVVHYAVTLIGPLSFRDSGGTPVFPSIRRGKGDEFWVIEKEPEIRITSGELEMYQRSASTCPSSDFRYAGNERQMEGKLNPRAGYQFRSLSGVARPAGTLPQQTKEAPRDILEASALLARMFRRESREFHTIRDARPAEVQEHDTAASPPFGVSAMQVKRIGRGEHTERNKKKKRAQKEQKNGNTCTGCIWSRRYPKRTCQAEIRDLKIVFVVNEEILWLEIMMYNTVHVAMEHSNQLDQEYVKTWGKRVRSKGALFHLVQVLVVVHHKVYHGLELDAAGGSVSESEGSVKWIRKGKLRRCLRTHRCRLWGGCCRLLGVLLG
ncbi:hypothetical protein B0H14DRAFT_3605437 [Mycena olivaceomarginata]|nr:hypothetical protein B0H14DRAFT_3605437 [Mycena olivaceomarginata]